MGGRKVGYKEVEGREVVNGHVDKQWNAKDKGEMLPFSDWSLR